MPQPTHDSDDTQPLRGPADQNHRMYIPATWAAPGHGGGHPKLSGGVTVDKRTGLPAPRAFNRPDQRYTQPQSTILANRSARANAEYATSVILLGAEGRYEVRGSSGNNYDVGHTLIDCDCPDWLRIDESGYGIIRCKHIYLVMKRLADPAFPNGPDWSCARLAEYLGISERTAEDLCNDGFFAASKQHNVWVIPSLTGFNTGLAYLSKCLFNPRDWSSTITHTSDAPMFNAGTGVWSQTFHFHNTAAFDFPELVRPYASGISAGYTPLTYDETTEVFLPIGSPYWTIAERGMIAGQIIDYTFHFTGPSGSPPSFTLTTTSGKGLI